MKFRRFALLTSAVVVGAMVLTGCSAGGEAAADEKSPLEKLFADIDGANLSDEEREQQWAEINTKTEELVAECMQKEGFEYVPVDQSTSTSYSFDADAWKPNDREWVSQYGYGAVNWPGRDDMPTSSEGSEYNDPNGEYVSTLSESEQTAYYEALYGPSSVDDGSGMIDVETEWNWETAGCYGWAQNENQDTSIWNSDEASAFNDVIMEFYNNPVDDPKLEAANAEWADCMASAGFTGFAKQEDAQQSIYEQINTYYEDQTEWIENDPELDKIGEAEVEIALADLDCRVSTNFTKRAQEVQFAAEEKFIAENKTVIDAFLAAAQKK